MRQERSQRSRAVLLESAAELFAERGYTGTSVAEVCSRTGLTKGAVYFHFPSKEALAAAIIQAQYDVWPPLIAELEARGLPPLEQLVVLTGEVALRFQHDVRVRAGVRLQVERDVIGDAAPTPFVGWIATLASLLRTARSDGSLRAEQDPEAVARVIVSAFFGIQHVSDVLTDRSDLLERLGEMWTILLPALTDDADLVTRSVAAFSELRRTA